jgi:hypothetical protein
MKQPFLRSALHIRISLILLLAVLAHFLLFVDNQPVLQSSAAVVLMTIAPGLLLAALILGRDGEHIPLGEWLSYGAGIGFGIGAGVVFMLGMLPGAPTQGLLLAAFDAIILVLSVLLWVKASHPKDHTRPHTDTRSSWLFVIAVSLTLLLAMGLRLINLGYSQLQGDEATPIVRASAFVQDGEEVVFLQPRGPLDTLIPAGVMVLVGVRSELALRLPFALASILAVGAVISLGVLLGGRLVGVVSGLMLALDGFAIGFGRVMHYESVILLTTIACIIALHRIWMLQRASTPFNERLARRYVWSAALLAATAMLAHYDGAIVLIVGGYLIFEWWRAGMSARQLGRIILAPGAFALGVVTAFYMAFVLHPNFGETLERYSESLIDDGGFLVNNLLVYVELAGFYYGAVQFYFLALIVWMAACLPFWRQRHRWWSAMLVGMGLALPVILISASSFAIPFDSTAVWTFVMGIGLVLTPSIPVQNRLLWIWFGAPFFAALFLTAQPGLHFYLFSPPLALLVGATIADLHQRSSGLRSPNRAQWSLIAALLVLTAINTVHLYRLFISPAEHAMQTKTEQSAPWLWPTAMLNSPILYYGMPYDGGWRTIEALYANGVLQGSYLSNIDRWITDWYTHGAEFCRQQPDYVIVDRFSQPESAQRIEAKMSEDYSLHAIVTANDEARLLIYSRSAAAAPRVFDVEDADLSPSNTDRPTIPITPWSGTAPMEPLAVRFGDDLALTGVRVDLSPSGVADAASVLHGGEHLSISLGWRLLQETQREYTVFLQLIDANAVKAGQRDVMPACNAGETTEWRADKEIIGFYRLAVDSDPPPGVYSLIVGIYDAVNQERLNVYNKDGVLLGDAVKLRDIRIE